MVTLGQLRWQFLKSTVLCWIGAIFLFDGLVFMTMTLIFTLTGVGDSILHTIFWLVGAAQVAIGLVLVTIGWRRCSDRARIVVDGTPTLGVVAAVVQDVNVRINGRHPYYLRYAFVDDLGQKQEGKSPYLPHDLTGRWAEGDRLLVLVDRDQPTRHVPDVTNARPEDLADLIKRWESGRPL